MTKGKKWDGKSRVSNDLYRKRFNEIFKKKGGAINTEESFISQDYTMKSLDLTEEEEKELQEIEDRNGF